MLSAPQHAGCRGLYGNAAGELALHHFQNPSSRIKQLLFLYLKPSKFIPTIAEGPNLSSVQKQYKFFPLASLRGTSGQREQQSHSDHVQAYFINQ